VIIPVDVYRYEGGERGNNTTYVPNEHGGRGRMVPDERDLEYVLLLSVPIPPPTPLNSINFSISFVFEMLSRYSFV